MRRPGRLALVPALVATLLCAVASGAAAVPAQHPQAVEVAEPTLEIIDLSPTAIAPGQTLRLRGVLKNTTTDTVDGVGLRLSVSDSPLSGQDQLSSASTGDYTPQTSGVNDTTVNVPSSLTAGARANWDLSVPVDDLNLGSAGVYYLRVSADFNGGTLGTASTYVPWFPPGSNVAPAKIVWLWPLSDWPDRTANDALLSEQTGEEVTKGGRLSTVLDVGLAGGAGPSWVVDPQVLQTVAIMSNGYQVIERGPHVVKGNASAFASQWIGRAKQGLANVGVYSMAYADPDITTLTAPAVGMPEIVVQATTVANEQTSVILGKEPIGSLGWPAGSRTDDRALDALQKAGVRTVVLDRAAVQTDDDDASSGMVGTQAGQLLTVLYDKQLSDLVADPGKNAADVLAHRQQVLALTAFAALENNSDEGPYVVIAPHPRWDPNPASLSALVSTFKVAPWARFEPVQNLIAKTSESAPEPDALSAGNASDRIEALGPRFAEELKSAQQKLDILASVLESPGDVTRPFSSAILRMSSSAWRTERPEGLRLSRVVQAQLDAETAKVRVLAGGAKNLSNERTQIPITIANDLDVPVRVGLRMTSTPAVRLQVDPVAPFSIPANRKVSIEVPAQVVGSGEVVATAQLTTPSGAPYGKPVEVTLRNSTFSQVATWVVVIAFAILVMLLVGNSLRRRRHKGDPSDSDPNSTGSDTATTAGGVDG